MGGAGRGKPWLTPPNLLPPPHTYHQTPAGARPAPPPAMAEAQAEARGLGVTWGRAGVPHARCRARPARPALPCAPGPPTRTAPVQEAGAHPKCGCPRHWRGRPRDWPSRHGPMRAAANARPPCRPHRPSRPAATPPCSWWQRPGATCPMCASVMTGLVGDGAVVGGAVVGGAVVVRAAVRRRFAGPHAASPHPPSHLSTR